MASNLLGNALTHGSAEKPIRFEASTTNEILKIEVANAGTPISPLTMQKLFQPFFRGEGSSAEQQGLGLGLYISSEIAKAHGGSLTVSSNEVETRFRFQAPNRPV
jgi:sigma-B regulation protein RsbU (phosphoserine phosphatase)